MRQIHNTTLIRVILLSIFCLAAVTNCGGKNTSAQAPDSLVREYIAKSQSLVDTTLADYYVSEEQQEISAKIIKSIDSHKKDGSLQSLQSATFDFSGLQISVVGEKEEYIHDEPFDFMKINASGSIVMKTADNSKNIKINDVIILEKIGKEWKVTEKINPFG